jgi:hypothetical protein
MAADGGPGADDLTPRLRRNLERNLPEMEKALLCLALGWIGDRGSAGRLLELYGDGRNPPRLRAFAARAIGLLGYRPALHLLTRHLEGASPGGTEAVVARASLEAVALLQDPAGAPHLRAVLFEGRAASRVAALGLAALGETDVLGRGALADREAVWTGALAGLGLARGRLPKVPAEPVERLRAWMAALGEGLDDRPLSPALSLRAGLDPEAAATSLILG